MDVQLTKADAAKILGVTPAAVILMEQRGELLATRTAGGVRLFARKDVERLAERREAAAARRAASKSGG